MKKTLLILVPCLAAVLVGFFGLRFYGRQYWERTLLGPFAGEAYVGNVTGTPTSVLAIPTRGQLEVYETNSRANPVVLLRSPAGEVQWSQLFVPEYKTADGTLERPGLRELKLRRWERRGTGPVVFVTCDWDWGGREGGMIEMDENYGFRNFRLSW